MEQAQAVAQVASLADALEEINGIRQQVIIAQIGRAGVRVGGTIECILETLAELENWPVSGRFTPMLEVAAARARDESITAVRQLLADALAAEEKSQFQKGAPMRARVIAMMMALENAITPRAGARHSLTLIRAGVTAGDPGVDHLALNLNVETGQVTLLLDDGDFGKPIDQFVQDVSAAFAERTKS